MLVTTQTRLDSGRQTSRRPEPRHRRKAPPQNRPAARKHASGFFCSEPPKTHLANLTQTLGTHQENAVFLTTTVSGCAVAPNSTTGTNHTVTVQSYIGASYVAPFVGDGRGPSTSPSDAYRTNSTIAVDPTNPSSSGTTTSSTGHTLAIVPGPNGPFVKTGHASPSGLTGTSNYISPGIVRVNLSGSAANPVIPGSPPITYNVSLSINFNTGDYAGSLTRTDFPSFQIFVDGSPIYESTETGTPFNLLNDTFVPIKGTLSDPN